jgi:hypothetical protein
MVLRRRSPDLERPFVTPLVWVVAPFAVLGCLYLFSSLQTRTIQFFFAWNAIGVAAYLLYGRVTKPSGARITQVDFPYGAGIKVLPTGAPETPDQGDDSMEAATATKPKYLGLLNAISNGESAAGVYLEAWADVTPDPDLACTLRLVAARERSHGDVFCRRIAELGFTLRKKVDPKGAEALARLSNPNISTWRRSATASRATATATSSATSAARSPRASSTR